MNGVDDVRINCTPPKHSSMPMALSKVGVAFLPKSNNRRPSHGGCPGQKSPQLFFALWGFSRG